MDLYPSVCVPHNGAISASLSCACCLIVSSGHGEGRKTTDEGGNTLNQSLNAVIVDCSFSMR